MFLVVNVFGCYVWQFGKFVGGQNLPCFWFEWKFRLYLSRASLFQRVVSRFYLPPIRHRSSTTTSSTCFGSPLASEPRWLPLFMVSLSVWLWCLYWATRRRKPKFFLLMFWFMLFGALFSVHLRSLYSFLSQNMPLWSPKREKPSRACLMPCLWPRKRGGFLIVLSVCVCCGLIFVSLWTCRLYVQLVFYKTETNSFCFLSVFFFILINSSF